MERTITMDIGRIADTAQVSQTQNNTVKPAAEDSKKNSTMAAENTDKFEHSTEGYTPAYTKQTAKKNTDVKTDSAYKTAAKSVTQMKNEAMKEMVEQTITGQTTQKKPSSGSLVGDIISKAYAAAEATSKDSEDYWGAEATAERIFTFAKTLADGNPEMFETMKNAFLTGFSQAEGVKGGKGKLPGVCYETYSKVMDKFDKWEKELNGTAETEETASSAE